MDGGMEEEPGRRGGKRGILGCNVETKTKANKNQENRLYTQTENSQKKKSK